MSETEKQKIILTPPPKPISQMTDEERREFATQIVRGIKDSSKSD